MYEKVVNKDEAQIEWEMFKQSMKNNFLSVSMPDLFIRLATEDSLVKQYLPVLAHIVLVFPASSVDCKRGFSTLKLVKMKTRNRLNSLHLDMLLQIKLSGGSPEQFPINRAYELWLHSRKYRSREKAVSDSDSDIESDMEM